MIRDRYSKQGGHAATISKDQLNWRQPAFWRNIFLYYWAFAFAGHILEVLWQKITDNPYFDPNNIPTFAPLAVPYGLGAVAVILAVWPLYKRFKKMNVLLVFVLAAVVTTAVEYLCALVIIAFMGHNPFWDYSNMPFNFQGMICLRNAVLFGIVATIFLQVLFPRIERRVSKISDRLLNDIFLLLATTYAIDVLLVFAMWLYGN